MTTTTEMTAAGLRGCGGVRSDAPVIVASGLEICVALDSEDVALDSEDML